MELRELTLGMAPSREAELDAFERLMGRHQRQVLTTALRLLGRLEDAQDAAQEVFLRLYRFRHRLDVDRDPAPWLYRMTVNVCHDLRRKRAELVLEDSGDFAGEAPDPAAALDRQRQLARIREGLKRLPEKERAAVVLRDIEGLSTAEVAKILGSSETTVRSEISRARLKLRRFAGR